MAIAYIGTGSNLGDRERNVAEALRLLGEAEGIAVTAASGLHETEPVGGPPGQGRFLNGAARLETSLSPQGLLDVLLGIEEQLGRVRTAPWGPRNIDLDLLLYDTVTVNEPDLVVPHPRMHRRRFVLAPLAEIAPDVVVPTLGLTVRELLDDLVDA